MFMILPYNWDQVHLELWRSVGHSGWEHIAAAMSEYKRK